jgi:hypothetical protein
MGKFEKAVQANSLETLRFVSSGKVVSLETDPLKFTVETADRVFVELDLTRYRDGNNSLGLTGCPSLIMDLLPIIKRNVGQKQRTRKAIRELSYKGLPLLFKAITSMRRQAGRAPERADDFETVTVFS